ncbi:olfactory receptor 4Q2-like [Anoplopoma fimbria]|uniref:olfactory receptor 4Q2-like n=1 Tax=Anoplopoma fimbria TaxID=229290 RepID=UPI0023EDA5F1|nr:olfactory receptor 4Q2-like [Anoplopoma fimbria]
MFTLSGLSGTKNYRVILFALTLLCYCVIWLVNLTIIVTVIVDKKLHEPMYIFICNLCINGLYGTAGFYPKFLLDLLSTAHVISYAGCLLQGFVLHSAVCADFSLLVLMAYDRYVAICRPLVYHSVMTKQRVCVLLFSAWLTPFFLMLISTVTTSTSRLCGSHIPKIFCVNWLMGKLACSSSVANIAVPAFNYTFYFGHCTFVCWSYIYMVRTCLKSKENRSKFMQTCVPHLFSFVIHSITGFCDIALSRYNIEEIHPFVAVILSLEFVVIPPVLNPLVYGLKLPEIKKHILKMFTRHGLII